MELIINTDLETALPVTIDFNYDQLKQELSDGLQKYEGMVVTEDAINKAKSDRAALRKLREAVDSKRKSVKKACLAPYEDFESRAEELIAMIDKPVAAIDRQIKTFEDAKKQEKYKALLQFYRSNIKGLVDLLPFEKVLPDKWANTTMQLKKINEEMLQRIEKARNEIGIITAMNLPYTEQMLSVYIDTLDMGAALAEKKRFEDRQKALEEMRVREAEAELREAARKRAEAATPPSPDISAPQHDDAIPVEGVAAPEEPPAAETTHRISFMDFRIFDVTNDQLKELAAFLRASGIRYGRVPKNDSKERMAG